MPNLKKLQAIASKGRDPELEPGKTVRVEKGKVISLREKTNRFGPYMGVTVKDEDRNIAFWFALSNRKFQNSLLTVGSVLSGIEGKVSGISDDGGLRFLRDAHFENEPECGHPKLTLSPDGLYVCECGLAFEAVLLAPEA
jgi:hypothetical protein